MSKEWELKSIDELATVSRGRSKHRPRNDPNLYGGSYPFVQTADIHASDLYINTFSKTYSDLGLAQSKLWKPGVLCITNAGENTGDCAILNLEACFPDSIIAITPDPERSDIYFLKYAVDRLKEQLRSVTKGATQDNLSVTKLTSFKFPVPPLTVQKRIGEILRSYGELIENNRRRIQLLEQSARLLYKEWFVHLRFPGHEHVAIVDGVPEGWDKKPLSHICSDVRQSVSPQDIPQETPYIGLEHIPRHCIALGNWGTAQEVDSNKFWFEEDDILFAKIRPYFHKVGLTFTKGITSSDAIVIRPCSSLSHLYCLMLLSSNEFVALASKTVKEGSKMPRADWKYLLTYQVLVPSKVFLQSFNEIIAPIISQLKNLTFQNTQLQQARDLLLPRLMNGDIAV